MSRRNKKKRVCRVIELMDSTLPRKSLRICHFRNLLAGIQIFLLSFAVCVVFAQTSENKLIRARSEIDKSAVTIGDKIKYSLIVEASKGVEVKFPEFGEDLGEFAIKDFGSKESNFFVNKKVVQWYLLDTYVTGKHILPKAVIKYKEKGKNEWLELEVGEKSIEVKSILEKAGEVSDIYDIQGPVNLPSKSRVFILIILGLIILSLIGAGVFILRKKVIEKKVSSRACWEIALERLLTLKNKDFINQGKIAEYYVEASDIIRRYIESRFTLKAPEMTTEEFLNNLKGSAQLNLEQKSLLKEFLNACDLVKFAKYAPEAQEIDLVYTSAQRFIEQTKKVEEFKSSGVAELRN